MAHHKNEVLCFCSYKGMCRKECMYHKECYKKNVYEEAEPGEASDSEAEPDSWHISASIVQQVLPASSEVSRRL